MTHALQARRQWRPVGRIHRRARQESSTFYWNHGPQEAEALEAKWKLEAFQLAKWGTEPEHTFEEVMLAFLKDHQHKRSADKDRQHVRRLRRSFGGRVMNGLTATDVRRYIAERRGEGVANATINRELQVLASAINYANREWDWNLPNPVKGRKLREPQGRVRWITRAEAAALVRAAQSEPKAPHLADFLVLALITGMRHGELLGLEWRRVDLNAGLLYLKAEHTKAARRHSVPVNAQAQAALMRRAGFRARHCPASPWVFCDEGGQRIQDVKRSFATACRRAGITDLRVHDQRHNSAFRIIPSTLLAFSMDGGSRASRQI
jgi:integrase